MIDPNNPTANAQQTFNDNFVTNQTLSLTNPNGQNGVWNTDYSYNVPNDPNASNFLPSNGEQQWYVANTESKTNSVNPFSFSSNGLTIQASQTPSSLLSSVKNQPYLSGELNTQGTFSQEYGLYEEKAQIPSGQGLWPAFWMVPENGQWPPELDVMESIGNSSQYYTTIHATSLANGYESAEAAVPNPSGYNTYAMDWEPDYTTFYINGKEVYQEKTPSDVNLPMYMETNLAVGGNWPGDPNSSTQFPADYNISDIQVYQSNANLAAGLTPQGSASYYGVDGSSGGNTGSGSGGSGGGSTAGSTSHDYTGDGHSQILIQSSNGAVVTGEVGSNGQLSYTQVSAIGTEWKFAGSGDFLGQGHDQYLLESASGAIDVGSVGSNGQATFTQVSAIGSGWTIEGSGDYLGDGHSQFVLKNADGAVDIGEVGSNGQVTYTQVASIGSEWKFVGTADVLGQGHDQFILENSNGAVDAGNVVSGHAQFTQVGALGSEWSFHM